MADARLDRIVLIGKAGTKRHLKIYKDGLTGPIVASVDPRGRWLAYVNSRGVLRLQDIEYGKTISLIESRKGWAIRAIRWMPISRRMLVLSSRKEPTYRPDSGFVTGFEPRTQVFAFDPEAGSIGPPLIDVPETASAWSSGDMIRALWPHYLASEGDWMATFTSGSLHVLNESNGEQTSLELDILKAPDVEPPSNNLPAMSRNGRMVTYKNGAAIYLRQIYDKSFSRKVMNIKSEDQPAMVWPDDRSLIVANLERYSPGMPSQTTIASYHVDQGGNVSRNKHLRIKVDWPILYLSHRISPDSKGIAIGVIKSPKNQLVIYSLNKKELIYLPLGFEVKSPVEILGWSKDWDD